MRTSSIASLHLPLPDPRLKFLSWYYYAFLCIFFIVIRQEGIFYLLPWKYPLCVNGCNAACTLVAPPLFFACEFCINCTILSLERKSAWCHPLGCVCVYILLGF